MWLYSLARDLPPLLKGGACGVNTSRERSLGTCPFHITAWANRPLWQKHWDGQCWSTLAKPWGLSSGQYSWVVEVLQEMGSPDNLLFCGTLVGIAGADCAKGRAFAPGRNAWVAAWRKGTPCKAREHWLPGGGCLGASWALCLGHFLGLTLWPGPWHSCRQDHSGHGAALGSQHHVPPWPGARLSPVWMWGCHRPGQE